MHEQKPKEEQISMCSWSLVGNVRAGVPASSRSLGQTTAFKTEVAFFQE